jgi:hypothetical protein
MLDSLGEVELDVHFRRARARLFHDFLAVERPILAAHCDRDGLDFPGA